MRHPTETAQRAARHLRHSTTEAEKELWWHLRRKLAPDSTHFRRQAPIGPYVVDFCCHAHRLIVELDGSQHAEEPQAAVDRKRDALLVERGYRVLRFWNAEVFDNADGVMETIFASMNDVASADLSHLVQETSRATEGRDHV